MAHYAKLNNNNYVEQVIVIPNEVEPTEADGIAYCRSLFGQNTFWKKASYNRTIRKNYPSPGYFYDLHRDAFISPKPFASWQFEEESCSWKPPMPKPDDGKHYRWDEFTVSWKEMT